MDSIFFDRDLSWLSFNARVLQEAQRNTVPLMELLKFLSIFSSNVDEFYRVRMPARMALNSFAKDKDEITVTSLMQTNGTHECVIGSERIRYSSLIKLANHGNQSTTTHPAGIVRRRIKKAYTRRSITEFKAV